MEELRSSTLLTTLLPSLGSPLVGLWESPGLHRLIKEIHLLELELECCLQVIHVPGLIMIDQGTDGLIRGFLDECLPRPTGRIATDSRKLSSNCCASIRP